MRKKKSSPQIQTLLKYLKSLDLEGIEQEHYFYKPLRRWRFDIAIPSKMLAIEYEGGNHWGGKSRHSFGTGFVNDMVKYNTASAIGWTVLRFAANHISSGEYKEMIDLAIKNKK